MDNKPKKGLKKILSYRGKYSKGLLYGFLYAMTLETAIKTRRPLRQVKSLYKLTNGHKLC